MSILTRYARRFAGGYALVLLVAVLAFAPISAHAQLPPDDTPAPDINDLLLEANGTISVIVGLNTATTGILRFDDMSDSLRSQVIRRTQDRVLLLDGVRGARNVVRYEHLPALALDLTPDGLQQLSASPDVTYVQVNRWRRLELINSTQRIGARGDGGAWSLGYTGAGQTVAVLDTGTDYSHPYLAGKRVAEACYGTNLTTNLPGNIPFIVTSLCPGGATQSTAVNSGAHCQVVSDPAHNECAHGTSVAGIAVGRDNITGEYHGVAPDATLISVKVFSKVSSLWCQQGGYPYTDCILAADADILRGLDFVYSKRNELNIAAVNLSLGGGRYFDPVSCDLDNPAYFNAAAQLNNAGIVVIAASGNNGYNNSMSAPACVSNIVSVGGTGNTGAPNTIWGFSNTAPFLDLVAPGFQISAPIPNNQRAAGNGTSFGAPHIAGGYAILRQYRDDAPLAEYLDAMKITGRVISDSLRGSFRQPRLQEAIAYLTIPEMPALVAPATGDTLNTPDITFTWQAGADTTHYFLQVFDAANNNRLVNERIERDTCTDVCAYTLTTVLPDNRAYEWRVSARNTYRTVNTVRLPFRTDYPGVAQLVAPAPNANFGDPDEIAAFSWNFVPQATEYRLIIRDRDAGRNILRVDLSGAELAALCDGTVCTYTLTPSQRASFASRKTYEWWVRSSNSFGASQTARRTFSTRFPPPPPLVSPEHQAVIGVLSTFEGLVWQPVSGATEYRVRVNDRANGRQIVNVLVPASACGVTCVYDLSAELSRFQNGRRYNWTIQARSALGNTPSEQRWFELRTPARPVIIAPAGDVIVNDPSQLVPFTWSAVADVDEYRVRVIDRGNNRVIFNVLVAADSVCDETTCAYTPTAQELGGFRDGRNYQWTVQARNSVGNNASRAERFRARFPGRVELVTPEHNATINRVNDELSAFVWQANPFATEYRLRIIDRGNNRVIFNEILPSAGLMCGELCAYSPAESVLGAFRHGRNYQWTVQARNALGSYNSAASVFRVRVVPVGKATLDSPADGTVFGAPNELGFFRWSAVEDATSYRLIIRDRGNGREIFREEFPAGGAFGFACDGTQCTYSVPLSLMNALRDGRNYEWWVVARNAAGNNASERFIFRARFPGAAELIAPADNETLASREQLTTLLWSNVPQAALYRLRVEDRSNNNRRIWSEDLLIGSEGLVCQEATCTYTVPQALRDLLRNGRNYRWFVISENSQGRYTSNRFTFRARFD